MGIQKHIERKRRTLRLAALGLAMALAPSLAWAGFSTPIIKFSPSGQSATDPQVAIDAGGDALVVWRGGDGTNGWVRARSRSATGALGQTFDLHFAFGSVFKPQVAMNAGGDALVVWARSTAGGDRIQARALSRTGGLGTTPFLSLGGAFQHQVAIDAEGDALVVWARSDGTNDRIQARARSASGVLGPIQTLSAAGANTSNPQVAIDADGDALVVWQHDDPRAGFVDTIKARARSKAGAFGPILTLSNTAPGNANAFNPQVAIDSDGDALVVWVASTIQGRARTAGGVLGPIQILSVAGADVFEPQVAIDADGDALVVWQRASRIQARARSRVGVLGSIQNLSGVSINGVNPQVATDLDGDAVVLWRRTNFDLLDRIQARTRSKTGVLGPIQIISGAGAGEPQIAVDADGDAVAVWRRHDGSNHRIEGAAGP